MPTFESHENFTVIPDSPLRFVDRTVEKRIDSAYCLRQFATASGLTAKGIASGRVGRRGVIRAREAMADVLPVRAHAAKGR
jgi:hypothetical protein